MNRSLNLSQMFSEMQFLCSICLEVFSEPVSTPCGHNFCKRCISQTWDTKAVFINGIICVNVNDGVWDLKDQ
uniref:RING-type domain-containing protein n=1 Tax=Neogobius melanostomus TaxID=47308 RepID=A0A8C6T8D2_9GOBI